MKQIILVFLLYADREPSANDARQGFSRSNTRETLSLSRKVNPFLNMCANYRLFSMPLASNMCPSCCEIFQFCAKFSLMFCHRQHLYGEARTAEDYAASTDNMGECLCLVFAQTWSRLVILVYVLLLSEVEIM